MKDQYGLTPRQRVFVDEWLTGEHTGKRFNGRAAYEYAGYSIPESNPSANASKLLRHPKVRAYIKKRMDDMTMSAEEVLMRFTELARGEFGEILTKNAHGRLTIDHDKVLEKKHLVKSFKIDSNGHEQIEFHDSMAALQQVTRILGMYKDELLLGGVGGGPAKMVVEFVDPEGEAMDLGPTNESVEEEDFSEFHEE